MALQYEDDHLMALGSRSISRVSDRCRLRDVGIKIEKITSEVHMNAKKWAQPLWKMRRRAIASGS